MDTFLILTGFAYLGSFLLGMVLDLLFVHAPREELQRQDGATATSDVNTGTGHEERNTNWKRFPNTIWKHMVLPVIKVALVICHLVILCFMCCGFFNLFFCQVAGSVFKWIIDMYRRRGEKQSEPVQVTVTSKADREIADLHARVDKLEQYSRRNCVRISGIPATDNENTDEVTKKLGAALGVTITTDMIDGSHRVGRPDQADRQIIVKFTSYRHKRLLMGVRRHLKHKTASTMGFSPPASAAEAAAQSTLRGVFVNDDLTRQRARLAAKARRLKQDRRIQDTWVRDGEIFIKRNEKITTVFNEVELGKCA
ncbi:uncharacterized protein [Littorina saxatilis]|uniref:Uncharacterized protein n=1 Tax=Littorina saxatilis TaxID=31220 RepID=A0AAN9ALQ2_9CAEN